MKNITYIIFVLFIFLSSCTEKIDFNLNSGANNRLVVDGSISDELKIHSVKLTRSINYFYNETAPAELDAKVTISDGENIFLLNDSDKNGIYTTDTVAGIPGKTYTLDIKLKTGEEYSAQSYMKPVGTMDSLRYSYENETDFTGQELWFYTIYLYAAESPIPGDYYLWDLYIDNVIDTDTLKEKVFVDDVNVNGNYIFEWNMFKIEEEKIAKDTTEIEVKMLSIQKQQYDYNLSLLLETVYKGSPFDGPPANVPTNISNNGMGFFSANAVNTSKIIIIRGENPAYWDSK